MRQSTIAHLLRLLPPASREKMWEELDDALVDITKKITVVLDGGDAEAVQTVATPAPTPAPAPIVSPPAPARPAMQLAAMQLVAPPPARPTLNGAADHRHLSVAQIVRGYFHAHPGQPTSVRALMDAVAAVRPGTQDQRIYSAVHAMQGRGEIKRAGTAKHYTYTLNEDGPPPLDSEDDDA